MAISRTINFLPEYFQTVPNQRFLSSTLDQLVSAPQIQRFDGYIGQRYINGLPLSGEYLVEPTAQRTNYQLEPNFVTYNQNQKISNVVGFDDVLTAAANKGAQVESWNRLLTDNMYTWRGVVDLDKIINYQNYCWVPQHSLTGQASYDWFWNNPILVNNSNVSLNQNFSISRVGAGLYVDSNVYPNPQIILQRGGSYTFDVRVDESTTTPGNIWIQAAPGVTGTSLVNPSVSTRNVPGVSNNGISSGTITFNIPSAFDQTNSFEFDLLFNGTDKVLYLQDDSMTSRVVELVILDPITENEPANLDIGTIIGQLTYTSGNGVKFSNGLHIVFDDTVYPAPYNDPTKTWIVEGVGTGITLVPTDQLVIPTNLQLQGSPADYITVNRASLDLNPWSRSNQWFPVSTIQYAANYLIEKGTITVDQAVVPQVGVRPIIEFFAGLGLFGMGSIALPAVNLYDSATLDAFENVQGAKAFVIDGQQVNQNDLVIFNADIHASIRQNIYRINFINPGSTASVNRLEPVQVVSTSNITLSGLQTIDGVVLTVGDRVLVNNPLAQPENGIYIASTSAWTLSSDFNANVGFGVYVEKGQVYNSTYFTTTGEVADNINFVQSTSPVIDLVPMYTANIGSCTTVTEGTTYLNEPLVWNDTNSTWTIGSQVKNGVQQQPKFDIVDSNLNSFSNISVYPETTFIGSELFSYAINEDNALDPVLGLPVVYGNVGNLSDLTFDNNFEVDSFTYQTSGSTVLTSQNINTGDIAFVNPVTGITSSYDPWLYVDTNLELYQNIELVGISEIQFAGKLLVKNNLNSQPTQVYVNGQRLLSNEFVVLQSKVNDNYVINVSISALVSSTSSVLIKILSSTPIAGAYYDVPSTFENNPFGLTLSTFTTTQLRNHAENTVTNVTDVETNFNLNQVIFDNKPGTIVIHEAVSLLPTLLLTNTNYNIDQAIKNAADDYILFKQRFLNTAGQINNIANLSSKAGVDSIFTILNSAQSSNSPWYSSDMVPVGGSLKSYRISNSGQVTFTVNMVHNSFGASNIGLLVYLTNTDGTTRQLIKGVDYTTNALSPTVTILTTLISGQTLNFYEMPNTDGCCVPATPTKLGLAPAYLPQMFIDNTYTTPTKVIQGHDGSITKAYGDYRDALLLEVELRIYNNLKVNNQLWTDVIETNVPTANRFKSELRLTNDEIGPYSFAEQNEIQSKMFYEWVMKYQVNYTESVYQQSNPFTWNWSGNADLFGDLPLASLPGGWRGIYYDFYNTIRPNLMPWEALNISVKPSWWDTTYGPAPYTGTNLNLWNDLQTGTVQDPNGAYISSYGPRSCAVGKLLQVIPVDESGNLLDPSECVIANLTGTNTTANYVFGDGGPAESAWRASSYYPFAKLRAQILQNPMFMCGMLWDLDNYAPTLGWSEFRYAGVLPAAQKQVQLHQVDSVNGTLVRKSSLLNYTLEYLRKQGRNPSTLRNDLNNTTVNLVHDMAGFADVNNISVYADQSTATQGSTVQIIPTQDYNLFLSENVPVGQLIYSGIIISKTELGYNVTGYDLTTPFFTILPENTGGGTQALTVGQNSFLIYSTYSTEPTTVAYNTVFPTVQSVVNFIIAYGRYLESIGLTFAENSSIDQITWQDAATQFVQWSYENWSISQSGQSLSLVLNPATSNINWAGTAGTLQNLLDVEQNSIIDVNQNLIGQKHLDVFRSGNSVNITTLNQAVIAGLHVNIVTFEHKLIVNNTTVFNDVIYDPISGLRQYRLRIAGQKTANWNGSLDMPGFILTTNDVPTWQPMVDYPSGTIVSFKNTNYMALVDVIGTGSFQFNQFTTISDTFTNSILPNLNLKGLDYSNAYNAEYRNYISDFIRLRSSTLGYKGNNWLNNLGIDFASQADFYRGWIKEKGSLNSVQAYGRASTPTLNTIATINEEYAVRLGEYGSTENTGFADVLLPNNATANAVVNPLVVTYTTAIDSSDTRTIQVTPNNLYNKSDNFVTNFIQPQGVLKTNTVGFQEAGPVLPQDILNTANVRVGALTSVDYSSLYFSNVAGLCSSNAIIQTSVLKIGESGGIFWISNDATLNKADSWNVIRFVPTTAGIVGVQQVDQQTITFQLTQDIEVEINTPVLINLSDATSNTTVQGAFLVSNYVVAPTANSIASLTVGTGIGQFNVGATSFVSTIEPAQTVIYKSASLRFDSIATANTCIVSSNFNLPVETNLFVDNDQAGWASYVYNQPYIAAVETVPVATTNISQAVGYDDTNSLLWVGNPSALNNVGEIVLKQVYNHKTSTGNVLPILNIDAASASVSRTDSYNFGYLIKSLNNLSAAISAQTTINGDGQVYIAAWDALEAPSKIQIQQILSIDGYNSASTVLTEGTNYGMAAADTYQGGASWTNVSNITGPINGTYASVNLVTPSYLSNVASNTSMAGLGVSWVNSSNISNLSSYATVQIAEQLNQYNISNIYTTGSNVFTISIVPNNTISANDYLYFNQTSTILDGNSYRVTNNTNGNITLVAAGNSAIIANYVGTGVVTDITITVGKTSKILSALFANAFVLPANVSVTGIAFNFAAYYSGSNTQPALITTLNPGLNSNVFMLSPTPQQYYVGSASDLQGYSSAQIAELISNLSVNFQATTTDTSSNVSTVYVNNLSTEIYYAAIKSNVSPNFIGNSLGNGTVWTNPTNINNTSSYSSVTLVAPTNIFGINSAVIMQTVIGAS